MTFIASVIAKKGIALIADSLVTTSAQTLEFEDYYKYIQSKSKDEQGGEIKLDPSEIIALFKRRASYTKDFQEKLFEFDKHTSIMTAGAAFLNGKSLEDIIQTSKPNPTEKKKLKTFEDKIIHLENHFKKEAIECLEKENFVRDTVLIISQYDKKTHQSVVHKMMIHRATPDDLKTADFVYVSSHLQSSFSSVICEGQNRLSERILWGDLETTYEIIPKIANKIFSDFKIEAQNIPPDYVSNLTTNKDVLPQSFYDDIKAVKLRELSLQQAIDLACLLMRIERDIQKYTENVPTVGGLVKVAVIDDGGFRFISGNNLTSGSF